MDDKIERTHKKGKDEKEEEGPKRDNKGSDGDAGEGEETEGSASLEDVSDNDEIDRAIASGQGTTTTNSKDNAKDDNAKEGRMVGIPQFWAWAMEHMEDVAKLITERGIYCLEHLTDITC